MKHTIYILLILLIASCKKEEQKKGQVTFYQLNYQSNEFYLDGKKIGRLGVSVDEPACGQNEKEQIRTFELTYGKHSYVMVDVTEGESDTFEVDVKYPCQIIKVEKP